MKEEIYVNVNGYAFYKIFGGNDVVPLDKLMATFEEMYLDNDRLKEEIEDMKEDIRDNYKPYSNKELYEDIEVL